MAERRVSHVVCSCNGGGDLDYVSGDSGGWKTKEGDGMESHEWVIRVCGRGTVCWDGHCGEFTSLAWMGLIEQGVGMETEARY